jgi:nucleotide-binding universal stress UspA family protein
MTFMLAGPASTSAGATRAEAAAPARIVVPVDGSPFAERALPVAAWVARATGAPLHLIEVVAGPDGSATAITYLHDLARRHGAPTWEVATDDDPVAAIAAAGSAGGRGLVCLSTRGRDRSAAVLGSVAAAVLDCTTAPAFPVGPEARPPCADDAPVVVAVEGAADDGGLVDVAARWATLLDRRLVIATVAGPLPSGLREGRSPRRARGPADAETHLAGLAAGLRGAVETHVVHDPISVRGGLIRFVDRTAGLLVMGWHRRSRPLRALLGSHTARVVHDVEVPTLVVPLDAPL